MGKDTPFLTVIVPVYNVEKYLEECLDSLVNQSEMDHKVIIVNDGSKDNSGTIAKEYEKKYPNLMTYVEQENKGLGAARNTGLNLVETPYVTFLDSDDWWECHFIEKVKKEMSRHDEEVDMMFTLPWIYDVSTQQIQWWNDKELLESLFYPYETDTSLVLNVKSERGKEMYDLEVSACRKILRTSFLRELKFRFPEGVKWEDVKPHFQLVHNAKSCIAIKDTGFLYRINTGNQITSGGGVSRLGIITVFSDTLQMAKDEEWSDKEIVHIIRMLWSFSLWSIELTNTEYIGKLLTGLHKLFKEIPKKYLKLYLKTCSKQRLRERVLTIVLRSPFYGILKDYRTRQKGIKWALRMRRIINFIRRR